MKLLVDTPEKVRMVMVQNITNDLTAFFLHLIMRCLFRSMKQQKITKTALICVKEQIVTTSCPHLYKIF